jgi:hypothetical protein
MSGDTLLQNAVKLVGSNLASKSIDKTLEKWADRIEESSPLTREQQQELGGIGMGLAKKDYMSPGTYEQMMGDYGVTGSRIGDQYGRLAGLYDDPMSNPIMQAVANLTAENTARRSAAGRGIQAGSFPAEMQEALMAALGQQYANIANPMNTTLSSLYSGQTNPMKAIDTLSGANARSAQSASELIKAGSGTQNALGSYITNLAAPAAIGANTGLQGMNTLYGQGGALRGEEDSGMGGMGSKLGGAIGSMTPLGPVGGVIGSVFGGLFD